MSKKLIGASMIALLASSFMAVAFAQAQGTSPTPLPTTTQTTEQTVGGGASPDGAPATGLGGS